MPIVGRIRPGVTLAQAQSDAARAFQARVGTLFPWRMPDDWNRAITVVPLAKPSTGASGRGCSILILAVGLVLVVACANVANLTLSRAAVRQREIGIRAAIGVSPSRVARQLLTESVLLASLGGTLGLIVAWQSLSLLKAVLPPDTPRLFETDVNLRVLLTPWRRFALHRLRIWLVPMPNALRIRRRAVVDSGGRSDGPTVAGPDGRADIAQVACVVLLVVAAGSVVRSCGASRAPTRGSSRRRW